MPTSSTPAPITHRCIEVAGISIAYREAGPPDGPVILLPHGYPCSSYQFRGLMSMLGDRWRTIAPDYPGFGYSATPELSSFAGTFDTYADFLQHFVDAVGLESYVIYLHDYGSQLGLRLALTPPIGWSG